MKPTAKNKHTMKSKTEVAAIIEKTTPKSAWARGVKAYALELLESCEVDALPADRDELKKLLLNGADNWTQYSFGGSAMIYDADICERLCSPSEIKKTRSGELQPNSRETWLDCQARALGQAFSMNYRAASSN